MSRVEIMLTVRPHDASPARRGARNSARTDGGCCFSALEGFLSAMVLDTAAAVANMGLPEPPKGNSVASSAVAETPAWVGPAVVAVVLDAIDREHNIGTAAHEQMVRSGTGWYLALLVDVVWCYLFCTLHLRM